jgi:hypothetical protein
MVKAEVRFIYPVSAFNAESSKLGASAAPLVYPYEVITVSATTNQPICKK